MLFLLLWCCTSFPAGLCWFSILPTNRPSKTQKSDYVSLLLKHPSWILAAFRVMRRLLYHPVPTPLLYLPSYFPSLYLKSWLLRSLSHTLPSLRTSIIQHPRPRFQWLPTSSREKPVTQLSHATVCAIPPARC